MAYLGTQPNDVKKNTGLYTPSEILQLTKDGSWGGSLELIEEQTVSGTPNSINFINLANNPYDVYFLTAKNVQVASDDNQILMRFSNDNGSSVVSSSNYDFANFRISSNGSTQEYTATNESFIGMQANSGSTSGYSTNFYIYFYNFLDSSKYSFTTSQTVNSSSSSLDRTAFGGAVLTVAETHNAISLFGNAGVGQTSGTYTLYGIKEIS